MATPSHAATKEDVAAIADRLTQLESRMSSMLGLMEKLCAVAVLPTPAVSPTAHTPLHALPTHAPPLLPQMSSSTITLLAHQMRQQHAAAATATATATAAAAPPPQSEAASPVSALPAGPTPLSHASQLERSVSPPIVVDARVGAGPRRGSLNKLHDAGAAAAAAAEHAAAVAASRAPAVQPPVVPAVPAAVAIASPARVPIPSATAAASPVPPLAIARAAIPSINPTPTATAAPATLHPPLASIAEPASTASAGPAFVPFLPTRLNTSAPPVSMPGLAHPESETPTSAGRRKSVVASLKKKNFLAVFRTTVIQAAKKQEMARHLPPPDHPEYFFRLNWVTNLNNNGGMVAPDFVAQMGKVVHLVDIRFANDVIEPLGYIPGVDWVPKHQIEILAKELAYDACVVLISADDSDARVAARTLNALGMPFACAMKGGMKDWRFMGFQTSRDKSILTRPGRLRKNEADKLKRKAADEKLSARDPPATAASTAVDSKGATTATAAAATAAAPAATTVSLSEIKSHIGDPLNIQWLKLAAFLLHARQSCVDGRDDSGVIGTPGGDMGEFVLSLTVLESLSGKEFSLKEVERLLRRRLEAFGRFYMHTDVTALDRLQAAFRADPRLSAVMTPIMKSPLEYRAFMRSPPQQYRAAIMEHQLNSNHFGCGHLRLLLQKSKEYKVRTQLVRDALFCFFTARWNGAIECEYMALSGIHSEGAVVTVYLDTKVASFTTIPLISPSCDGKQIFVNHPQVSSFLRQQHGLFYTAQTDMVTLSEAARDEYVARVEALAALHAGNTLGYLANGLPCYRCKFQKPKEAEDGHVVDEHPFTVGAEGFIGGE